MVLCHSVNTLVHTSQYNLQIINVISGYTNLVSYKIQTCCHWVLGQLRDVVSCDVWSVGCYGQLGDVVS